jgi:para-aminobenzoate synthetase component 1
LTLKEKLNFLGLKREPFFFCISYDMSHWEVHRLSQLPNNIKFEINTTTSKTTVKLPTTNEVLSKIPISFDKYKMKFDKIQEQIRDGNTYLINLTDKTNIDTNYSLKELYELANARFKLYFKDEFICFSPERFVKCNDNKIFTYPMKGTIDASIDNAKERILNDKKELAEHTMVVDLLRNDLSMVASSVQVDKFRYCENIQAGTKELIQISSQISGDLNLNWQDNIGDILTTLLPAGSITGTPKKSTIKIIEDIERYDRNFFTGVFGIFDGINLDSAVMIRFIEKNKDNSLVYKSGGGITCDSKLSNEYQEMIDKVYI